MPTATRTPVKKVAAKKVAPKSAVAHLVPEQEVLDNYVNRSVWGTRDLDLFNVSSKLGMHVLLEGPTGSSKSTVINAFCAWTKRPVATIDCNGGIDPNTFWGMLQQNPTTGKIEWVWSEIALVIMAGGGGILEVGPDGTETVTHPLGESHDAPSGVLHIQEINFLHGKVSAIFHSLLREGQVSVLEKGNIVIKAGDGFQCFGSYNAGYEGTRPLNAALKNRFAVAPPWGYLREVEEQLVYMPVLLDIADKLRARVKEGDLETPVATNMLMEFEVLAVNLGIQFALENFIHKFHEDERTAVREVLALHATTIQEQFAEMERISQEG